MIFLEKLVEGNIRNLSDGREVLEENFSIYKSQAFELIYENYQKKKVCY